MAYDRVIEVTQPFMEYLHGSKSPYQNIAFHLGDCALNHSELPQIVHFLKSNNVEGWKSIPSDGFHYRARHEWLAYLQALRQSGTEFLEFTLYGTEATHDWFAGYKGSYEAIHSLAELWHELGGLSLWSIFVHKRNLQEISVVCREVQRRYQTHCSVAVWSYLGWGTAVENLRIEKKDIEQLGNVEVELSSLKTEKEWISELFYANFPPFAENPKVIHLVIDSTGQVKIPYTIARVGHNGLPCGQMFTESADLIMKNWQQVYRTWLSGYPMISALCQRYGDMTNEKLYDIQSVIRKWCSGFENQRNAA